LARQIEGHQNVSRPVIKKVTLVGSRHKHMIPPRYCLPTASQSIILIGVDRHSLLASHRAGPLAIAFLFRGFALLTGPSAWREDFFCPGQFAVGVLLSGSVGGGVILTSYMEREAVFERHMDARILVPRSSHGTLDPKMCHRRRSGRDIKAS